MRKAMHVGLDAKRRSPRHSSLMTRQLRNLGTSVRARAERERFVLKGAMLFAIWLGAPFRDPRPRTAVVRGRAIPQR
jgi:hypothetical protein